MLQNHVSKTKKPPKVHRISWGSGDGKNAEIKEGVE